MVSIKPTFPPNWAPDEETDCCSRCNGTFTMLNRKHHCRACGKIFCADCSAFSGSIPSYVHRVYNSNGSKGLRLCSGCNMLILEKKKSKRFILIFSMIPLAIKELEVLLYINKEWNTAIACVIGMFKSIQYKTGYKKWTGLERRMLKTHWREFVGHSRLMVQVFNGMSGITELSTFTRHFKCSKKTTPCSNLYCDSRLCRKDFNPFDILELLYSQHTPMILNCPELESWIGTTLSSIHVNWLIKFLPWFIQMGKSPAAQRIISNNLIPIALDSLEFAYAIYFECEMLQSSDLKSYYMAIQSRLMSCLDKKTQDDIRKSHRLLRICEDPIKLSSIQVDVDGIRLPYDPKTIVRFIVHSKIRQVNSFTKPWIIPMETSRGKIEILQKNEDIRKDRLVITTMHLLRCVDSRLTFHTYHVFPITCENGWIEMIPKSKTVYDINRTSTIQNYIISLNRAKCSAILRDSFMFSCTSNCVLGYMLGLGDRNLHNILICGETATIANIDFSYLLGYDPKNIESTEMKITSGMVDMLGGYDSQEFNRLKTMCSSIYASLRIYTYFWYALFRYLPVTSPSIQPHGGDLKTLQLHIDNRLMPNATDEEVKVAIVKSVNSNSDSWQSSISDMAHCVKTNITGMLFNLEL